MKQANCILLVEDDLNLGFVIKDNLESSGFEVTWATNGEEGLKKALHDPFDMAILDVMLPKKGGFEIAEELVEHKPDLPFLFLTAKAMVSDKVKGLKLGQDYLTKPFEYQELEARVKNILDRSAGQKENVKNEFDLGDYHFDYVNQYLTLDDKNQKLTKKEADLLRLLCLHKNEVMQRELALKSIWGSDDYFNGRSMDVFISRLRKYLKNDEKIQLINVHGVGFKLAIKED
ncbi:MAG: response regulator transcription factor [Vicingaceae bacterium]